jgi:hypothetical protein
MNHSFSLPIYIPLPKERSTTATNTYSTAAAWLACGLDVNKVVLPAVGRATNSRTVGI